MTTVDPPELVRFIISQFDYVVYEMRDESQRLYKVNHVGKPLMRIDELPSDVDEKRVIHFEIPDFPMRKLIVKHKFPPTRFMRYCCEDLKEINGMGRVVVTGVRWAESKNRKENQGVVTVFSSEAGNIAEEQGANFSKTVRGGSSSIWITQQSAGRLNCVTGRTKPL